MLFSSLHFSRPNRFNCLVVHELSKRVIRNWRHAEAAWVKKLRKIQNLVLGQKVDTGSTVQGRTTAF